MPGAGMRTKREKQVCAFIFRSCLTLIAIALGLATNTIRRDLKVPDKLVNP